MDKVDTTINTFYNNLLYELNYKTSILLVEKKIVKHPIMLTDS